jgi:hypothetical protein
MISLGGWGRSFPPQSNIFGYGVQPTLEWSTSIDLSFGPWRDEIRLDIPERTLYCSHSKVEKIKICENGPRLLAKLDYFVEGILHIQRSTQLFSPHNSAERFCAFLKVVEP